MATMFKTKRGSTQAEAPAKKRVLILDDHMDRLQSLRAALTGAGYAVDTASEAEEALAKSSSRCPDLIVVDLGLPGSAGLPLARSLLLDPGLESIPVIAITEGCDAGDRRRELADLFDGYFCDPIDATEVARQIQDLLARPEPASGKPNPAKHDGASGPALVADERTKAESVLQNIEAGLPESQFDSATLAALQQMEHAAEVQDRARLPEYLRHAGKLTEAHTARGLSAFRSLVRLSRELLSRGPDPSPEFDQLREQYIENRCLEVGALENAVRNLDLAPLATEGHNLKGNGAAYGFDELTELGRALESASKTQDALQAEALLERIEFYLSLARGVPVHG